MEKQYSKKQIDIMRKFIDAGFQIAQEECFAALSVRSLATKTNYNSASIYYYFPSFEHLQIFVSLKYLSGFFKELWHVEQNYINSIDLFLKTFKIFIHYITLYPNQFEILLFNESHISLQQSLHTYKCIYPDGSINVQTKFPLYSDHHHMQMPLLDLCISHGHIKSKSREKIIELSESIVHTLIAKAKSTADPEEKASIEYRFFEYICLFMESYKTPIGILNIKNI